jgi:hypothetical protein
MHDKWMTCFKHFHQWYKYESLFAISYAMLSELPRNEGEVPEEAPRGGVLSLRQYEIRQPVFVHEDFTR